MDSPQGTAEYFTMQAKSNSSKHGKNQLSTTAALTAAPQSLPPQPLGGGSERLPRVCQPISCHAWQRSNQIRALEFITLIGKQAQE